MLTWSSSTCIFNIIFTSYIFRYFSNINFIINIIFLASSIIIVRAFNIYSNMISICIFFCEAFLILKFLIKILVIFIIALFLILFLLIKLLWIVKVYRILIIKRAFLIWIFIIIYFGFFRIRWIRYNWSAVWRSMDTSRIFNFFVV